MLFRSPKEKPLSLYIPQNQQFEYKASKLRTLTSKRYPDVQIHVQVNENMIDFYNTYPTSEVNSNFMTRWAMYANTPLDEHVKEKQGVFFLIKMVLESYEIPKNLKDEYERMKHQCCDMGKNEIIDSIVEEGVREGLIREENVFLRRAAVETQLSVYFMYRIAEEKKIELDLEADFLREYVYQNLLKLLG